MSKESGIILFSIGLYAMVLAFFYAISDLTPSPAAIAFGGAFNLFFGAIIYVLAVLGTPNEK